MSLNDIGKRSHEIAVEKGFYDREPTIEQRLLLAISELVEAYEHIRDGCSRTEIFYVDEKPDGFPIELADAIIRITDNAHHYGIDLDAAVELKIAFNARRPRYHGRAGDAAAATMPLAGSRVGVGDEGVGEGMTR